MGKRAYILAALGLVWLALPFVLSETFRNSGNGAPPSDPGAGDGSGAAPPTPGGEDEPAEPELSDRGPISPKAYLAAEDRKQERRIQQRVQKQFGSGNPFAVFGSDQPWGRAEYWPYMDFDPYPAGPCKISGAIEYRDEPGGATSPASKVFVWLAQSIGSAVMAQDGKYLLPGVVPGRYHLIALSPYSSRGAYEAIEVTRECAVTGTTDLTLTRGDQTLEGIVVDGDGDPVEGAEVILEAAANSRDIQSETFSTRQSIGAAWNSEEGMIQHNMSGAVQTYIGLEFHTDADGRFRYEHLTADDFRLTATSKFHHSGFDPAVYRPGGPPVRIVLGGNMLEQLIGLGGDEHPALPVPSPAAETDASPPVQCTPKARAGMLGLDFAGGENGTVALKIVPGARAERAGARQDDVLRAINFRPIRGSEDIAGQIMFYFWSMRHPLTLDLERDGQPLTVTIPVLGADESTSPP